MNLSEWDLIPYGPDNRGRPILVHKYKNHNLGACVVKVGDRYECWICGTEVPEPMLNVALLALVFFPEHSQDYLDNARRKRMAMEVKDHRAKAQRLAT